MDLETKSNQHCAMAEMLVLFRMLFASSPKCLRFSSSKSRLSNSCVRRSSSPHGIKTPFSPSSMSILAPPGEQSVEMQGRPIAMASISESIGTEEIAELPDKSQAIYVYCRSGIRSKQASQKLVDLGYTNVIEFGGIIDYSGELEKGRQ